MGITKTEAIAAAVAILLVLNGGVLVVIGVQQITEIVPPSQNWTLSGTTFCLFGLAVSMAGPVIREIMLTRR